MAGIVPIMIASIVFNTVYAQMSTVFVEQARALSPAAPTCTPGGRPAHAVPFGAPCETHPCPA